MKRICKFLENLGQADTPGTHYKLLLLATVNLKGREALVSPGGGLLINATARAFCSARTGRKDSSLKVVIDPFKSHN